MGSGNKPEALCLFLPPKQSDLLQYDSEPVSKVCDNCVFECYDSILAINKTQEQSEDICDSILPVAGC